MPKVSIIIPVYNAEKYLAKCLDSVCNQTLKDIEIICINDCSVDSSLSILQKFAKNDDRVKVIDFAENKGAGAARNYGICQAKGGYIGFVDSDDFIDLEFYEKLYKKSIETKADIIKCSIKSYIPSTNELTNVALSNLNDKIKKNKAYSYYFFTTGIYNKKIIKENSIYFLEGVKNFEDPYFSVIVSHCANEIQIIDDTYYYYTENNNSASRKITASTIEDIVYCSKKIFLYLNENNANFESLAITWGLIYHVISGYTVVNAITSTQTINSISKAMKYIFSDFEESDKYFKHYLTEKMNDEKKCFFIKTRKKLQAFNDNKNCNDTNLKCIN